MDGLSKRKIAMDKNRFVFPLKTLGVSFLAVLAVGITTVPLALIGRQTLGEAVIALLYLVPVAWSGSRWGLVPGLSAALAAALCFDFLFIPPFFTFAVGSLEGWLVLAIFLGVAVLVVERIQASLTKAHEAVFMYELSSALSGKHTQEAAARTVARHIRQLFQANLVNVYFQPENRTPGITVAEPRDFTLERKPDRVIPIENAWGLVGEIQIWRGGFADLPPEDSRLLRNFAMQTAQALERTRMMESREAGAHPSPKSPAE
jgi:two-component system sensor histidine kinase KdpD